MVPAADEGRGSREQADGHEDAAHQLDAPRAVHDERRRLGGRAAEQAEDLLEPMLREQEPRQDAGDGVDGAVERLQESQCLLLAPCGPSGP